MSEWDSTVRQTNVVEVYKYYGAQPYFTSTEQAIPNGQVRTDTTTPPTHPAEVQQNTARPNTAQPDIAQANARECSLGEVQRASKLMGSSVRNMQDEKIGKVDNMMVDLPAGRVVEVIVASGGFLGLGDELSAVPPQSFHAGTQPDALTLDTTKEALANAPHFKSSDWANAENPEQIGMVYHSYNVQPYFDANAPDNTAQNVRDRNDSALTPLSQGTSAADVETTREIRKQIEAADGFSVDARNVKVITINGRVTLRGPVNTDDEKRQIADIANKVASNGNVDNQLQVENTSNTNSAK
jgi:sporulation protein YlmC with PRC-barrel domain